MNGSVDKPAARPLRLVMLAVLLVAGALALVEVRVASCAFAVELARRARCRSNVRAMYEALRAYEAHYGEPARSLEILVREGLLERDRLVCPGAWALRPESERHYTYRPDNWSVLDAPIVLEGGENHAAGKHMTWLERALSGGRSESVVVHRLFSDGRIKELPP
jgi:competence protein ComGC